MEKIITHQVELRLAKKSDLLHGKGLLKFGEIYYIKNPKTHVLAGPFALDKFHNSTALKPHFDANSIYVPIIDFSFEIMHTVQQVDFKQRKNYD